MNIKIIFHYSTFVSGMSIDWDIWTVLETGNCWLVKVISLTRNNIALLKSLVQVKKALI